MNNNSYKRGGVYLKQSNKRALWRARQSAGYHKGRKRFNPETTYKEVKSNLSKVQCLANHLSKCAYLKYGGFCCHKYNKQPKPHKNGIRGQLPVCKACFCPIK